MTQLADLHHALWQIRGAFKRLKPRLLLKNDIGLFQNGLLVDLATKVLADNAATLLTKSMTLPRQADKGGVRRRNGSAHRAHALTASVICC